MKKKLSLLISILFMSAMLGGCSSGNTSGSGGTASGGKSSSNASEFDNGEMRSDFNAMTCAKEMGVGINLGNTFEAYWEDTNREFTGAQTIGENTPQNYETCWGAVVTTPECIDGMKSAGFRTVRIPVYWGNMMENDGKYQINSEYLARIKEIVDDCRKNNMYVIVNIHHYDEFLIKHQDKEEVLKAVGILWEQIADYFKDYSDYLVFEGYNEALGTPRNEGDWAERSDEAYAYVNEMNQVFVDTVRKTGGNNTERILIASGYWTNIDNTTNENFKMPSDSASDKMMVSVHYIDNAMFWTNQVGNQKWLQYSTDQCEELKNRFTAENIPVFVGECTAVYPKSNFAGNAEYTESSECLQMVLDMAVDYGFVPVLWDTNDNFYSRTENKIKSDSDQAVITEIAGRFE